MVYCSRAHNKDNLLARLTAIQAKSLIFRSCQDLITSIVKSYRSDVSWTRIHSTSWRWRWCGFYSAFEDFSGLELSLQCRDAQNASIPQIAMNTPLTHWKAVLSKESDWHHWWLLLVVVVPCKSSRIMKIDPRWLSLNAITFTPTMAEDESAKLWKVNRTIHELVKDRVRWLRNPMSCRNLTEKMS